MKSSIIPFSVCMSVYKNDNATDFITAVHSITTEQTVKPSELILVIDGPISNSLENTIQLLASKYNHMKVIRFKENQGHAAARQAGVNAASFEWVAIMDSDDIAIPNRFEKQIEFISTHKEVAIVGGQIEEFIHTPEHIVGKRVVPCDDSNIKEYLKSRCPMNLVTVMFSKTAILSAGGFIDWYCEEDYYLWIRMTQHGCMFTNLPDTLVYVRVGEAMYTRRGGWRYFKSERGIQRYMLQHGLIALPRYVYNVAGRFAVQVLMTNSMRGWVFKKIFRR